MITKWQMFNNMGCCFSNKNDLEPSTTSNLLNGPQRKYCESNDSPTTTIVSARQFRPPDRGSDTLDGDGDGLIVTKMKPLAIKSMNKTFQDQEKLYNDVSKNYNDMTKDIQAFKSDFEKETSGIPELTKCVPILVNKCGKDTLEIERRKNCVQIKYLEKTIVNYSTADPQDILRSLKLFNSMNKHLEKVLDRSHSIQNTINIILRDEESMRLQITKESLPAAEGTETMHNCIDNIKVLEQMRKNIEIMQTKAESKLKDIIESSKGFFENTN